MQLTETEKMWQIMDRDEDGYIRKSDAEFALKKYKKSLPTATVQSLFEVCSFASPY